MVLSKKDADIRKDFPGGWPDDRRSAFTKKGRTNQENDIWNFYSTLLNWREKNATIHNGKMMQFTSFNDNIYSLFRYDEKKVVGLLINPTDKKINVVTSKYDELVEDQEFYFEVISGKKKKWKAKITVPPMGFKLIEFTL